MTGFCCFCLPSDSQVWAEHAGSCLTPNLQFKQKVLTIKNGKVVTSSFLTYLHYDPFITAQFIVINCGAEKQLRISPDHLVFHSDSKEPIPAKKIQVGHRLLQLSSPTTSAEILEVEVTGIKLEEKQGAFAPLTSKGTLIVDGFLVSCYAHVPSHQLAHRSLGLLRAYYTMMGNGKTFKTKKVHEFAKILLQMSLIVPNSILALDPNLQKLTYMK